VAIVRTPTQRGLRRNGARPLLAPTLAAAARNVALNPSGVGLPRAIADGGWGCGNQLPELLDGVTQYPMWEHGWAFPPSHDICIGADTMPPHGTCGVPRTNARPCNGDGKLVDGVACGERVVTIELAKPEDVIAVRAWHHGPEHAPTAYRVDVRAFGE
jgi:hypothetical protein